MTDPVLIIFAKTPTPGQVKTRLQPQLSAKQAALVASLLVEFTVRLAHKHWPGKISLLVWPSTEHPLFSALGSELDISVKPQCAGDLGEKMFAALVECGHAPAAIMGCDVPQCPGDVLCHAAAHLNAGRNVVGPTHDGGYYLIGLQEPEVSLFTNIEWGTDRVFNQTMQQAARTDTFFKTIPTLIDIDCFDDLATVASGFPALNDALNEHTIL